MLPASPQSELSFAPAAPTLTPEQRELLERLGKIDVDSLSPRAALELLYELVRSSRKS